jgi:hypothetical protein
MSSKARGFFPAFGNHLRSLKRHRNSAAFRFKIRPGRLPEPLAATIAVAVPVTVTIVTHVAFHPAMAPGAALSSEPAMMGHKMASRRL